MSGECLFLGTGASLGTPVIGCQCAVCRSFLPHDRRLRSSILLTVDGKKYLVDVGPDFREQALKFKIDQIDGVIITHSHYDHIGGLDELRIFFFRNEKPVPCLMSRETLEEVKVRYHYLMPPSHEIKEYQMKFDFQMLEEDHGMKTFEGLDLTYFSYFQVGMKVTGLRIKNFAYIIDITDYSNSIYDYLQGVETLVIDGATWERTTAHFGIEEAIAFAKKVNCQQTYLTHIAHETGHKKTEAKLPIGMNLAYDGLKLKLW